MYIYNIYIIVDMAHMGRYKYGISRDIPPPKLGSNLMISDDIGGLSRPDKLTSFWI